MSPAISLFIATFNRSRYTAAAVGSVLNQTRGDFELIVWDDGSTDDTLDVVRKAAGDDPRVRVIAGKHAGPFQSINSAAALARAPYIGWLDSDDAIAPTCLADTSAVLDANPQIGMVYTGYVYMDRTGRVRGPGKRCQIPYSKERLLTDFMTFQFRLMRKPLFDEVGGMNESMSCAADYDLCLKLSEVTEVAFVNKPLYFYRVHDDSISQTRRLDQITESQHAVQRALERRGLADQYELRVQLIGKFSIRKKGEAGSLMD